MYNVKVKRFASDSVQIRFYSKPIIDPEIKFSEVTGEIYERKRSDGRIEVWNPFTEEWERVKDISDSKKREHSFLSSRNRSKAVIYDIARANTWEWFLTFTFSSEFSNRFDYHECSKKLTAWLNNVRKRGNPDMKYLVVPEQHKDGAWHFHGLFADVPAFQFVDSGVRDASGRIIYNVGRYKWGFTTATKVSDTGKACGYLVKYVTKELIEQTAGKKRYWASRNCSRPEEFTFCIAGSLLEKLEGLGIDADYIKKVFTPTGNQITYVELNHVEEPLIDLCDKSMFFS